MKSFRTSNTCCDAATNTLRCRVCGDCVPMPRGSVRWVADVLRAFARAHRQPGHATRQTWFAPPEPKQMELMT